MRYTVLAIRRALSQGGIGSAEWSLRGRTALAFLDDACIGAGKVEEFRPDLKAAVFPPAVAGAYMLAA